MKVLLADYGGYPFIHQLALALGARGHDVLYVFRDSSRLRDLDASGTPRREGISRVRPVHLRIGRGMAKGNLAVRWLQERAFGRRLALMLREEMPDVLVSANMPLDAQNEIFREARKLGVPTAYWLQDLIGTATRSILASKLGLLGRLAGSYYVELENRLVAQSDGVIAISERFRDLLWTRGVRHARLIVHPNWSPLDEIPLGLKDNPWARAHGLADRPVVLYSGSLGMKHDPRILITLAQTLRASGETQIVAVAEGAGAAWLSEEARTRNLENVHVLPFQDRAVFPQVLATADVLVALLEPAAGSYSVPSKVLSYLCAGRPIVAAVPAANDVAIMLENAGAGVVCPPGDDRALASAVRTLLDEEGGRADMGQAARALAERTFDIDAIAGRFEAFFLETAAAHNDAWAPP